MFCARLPSSFSTSRLPRNLHRVATWRSPDTAIRKNTRRDTSKVVRLPREMTMEVAKVLRLPRKLQLIFWKRCKSIAPATQNGFWMLLTHHETCWNVTQCHVCHAKLSYTNGCGRLRTVADVNATSSEHILKPPDPQSERGTLATHSGKRDLTMKAYGFDMPFNQ